MERAGEGALHRRFAVSDGHSSPRVATCQGELGYDNDERVIAIIADGVGNSQTADIVKNTVQVAGDRAGMSEHDTCGRSVV